MRRVILQAKVHMDCRQPKVVVSRQLELRKERKAFGFRGIQKFVVADSRELEIRRA
jgi:hypothetical protein